MNGRRTTHTAASHTGGRYASGKSPCMSRPVLVVVLALLSLAGCQSGLPGRSNEALFSALSGGTFTLHHDVVIVPGRTTITFQNGMTSYGASEYEPRCELEVRDILDTPQTIPAGSYRIVKVTGMTRYVSYPPGGTLLAAAGMKIHKRFVLEILE